LKQALKNKEERRPLAIHMGHRLREGVFLISLAMGLFLLVSFATYHGTDPGWSSTGIDSKVLNWGGRVGAFLADIFLSLFGIVSYFFPPLVAFAAWLGAQPKSEQTYKMSDLLLKSIGFIFIVLSCCGLVGLANHQVVTHLPAGIGGIIGDITSTNVTHVLNTTGGILFFITALLCGITLFTGLSWLGLLDAVRWQLRKKETPVISEKTAIEPTLEVESNVKKPVIIQRKEPIVVAPASRVVAKPKPLLTKSFLESPISMAPGTLPPLTLLNPTPPSEEKAFSHSNFEELSQLVEQRLLDFGVEVKVTAVHPGPVITRFELELAPGIKVSKISGLSKDIARSLSATSVRVVEVIPGKSVIGLELPNEHREIVGLRELLESQRYAQSKSPVSLALGKDIAGFPVVVDLAKMPHLLVAGTTGAGKSVSINAMLLSLLFKATPEHLRIILIDPKMLELSIYEGIPHLLTPVITDMKDAANSLRWCVTEMDRRYKLMAGLGVRNLASYNQKVVEAEQQGNPIAAPVWLMSEGKQQPYLKQLPMIVVVADELADMMMVVGKKVEDLITRIAQKARAAGIHLILATQRPSVDVITGLIKANVPTRIAFQVSSRIDSRTILDQQGAEQLLGNGDMLYLPPGAGVPVRVHGAYVADEEVHRVVAAWQTYGKPAYINEVTEGGEDTETTIDGGSESDPLFDDALRIVTETRRASISLIQRKLKIGYNRAATIMDSLEAAGVVSSVDHSGAREVLAPPPVEV